MSETPRRPARIGVVTASDRASSGIYEDVSGPAIEAYLSRVLISEFGILRRVIPDGLDSVRDTIVALVDEEGCDLVLTTGGTGPSDRDLTPEATMAAAPRLYPGFGELMRQVSLREVPTAILSRQVAVIRGRALIINLPGQPKAIAETLSGLPTATPPVPGIFAAVPYCIDLIGGPYIETDAAVVKAFRPKSAIRKKD